MAFSFRELPWYLQALVYLLLLVALVAVGEYAPYSPVQSKRQELERTQNEVNSLTQEVALLQDVQRRHSQFRTETEALQRQLDTLRAIVPEEKEVDEFIRILQSAAAASNVSIRRITAKPVTPRDYYNEMPFELEIDGPYFPDCECGRPGFRRPGSGTDQAVSGASGHYGHRHCDRNHVLYPGGGGRRSRTSGCPAARQTACGEATGQTIRQEGDDATCWSLEMDAGRAAQRGDCRRLGAGAAG
jgi:prefoldin subunit 5